MRGAGASGRGMASNRSASSFLNRPAGAKGDAAGKEHDKKKSQAVESTLQGTQQEVDKVVKIRCVMPHRLWEIKIAFRFGRAYRTSEYQTRASGRAPRAARSASRRPRAFRASASHVTSTATFATAPAKACKWKSKR